MSTCRFRDSSLPRASRRPALLVAALLVTLATLPGCAALDVKARTLQGETAELGRYGTYAWTSPSVRSSAGTSSVSNPGLTRELRSEVDDALDDLGLAIAPAGEADLLLQDLLGVEIIEQKNDPYFSQNAYEKIEHGVLVLDITERATKELVWQGEARVRLRTVAYSVGVGKLRWVPLDNERTWREDAVVSKLVKKLPKR